MKTELTPLQTYNQRFEHYLLRGSYSSLCRPCDNPHVNFKELRCVKPHGVSYAAFEQAVGHRYRKTCSCIMCVAVTKGQVIGILPEPVDIVQKIKRKPFTMAIASIPEPPKPRPLIRIEFEQN